MEGKTENHATSAAAFLEGGIQEACDDACSICLEEFSKSDPATLTNCEHEFHLQCILEWCQRSSHCPMCWQSISLKDATSQELLEAVELERSLRATPSTNAAIFHHPALGGFQLQQLPMGVNDADIEERIIQHLAAAAMSGAHHRGPREGQRTRPSARGRRQFVVFSTPPRAPPSSGLGSATGVGNEAPSAIHVGSPSIPLTSNGDEPSSSQQIPNFQAQGSTVQATNFQGTYTNDRSSTTHSSLANQDRVGPSSESQSVSDSLLSKFNIVSQRYKETISKGTRGWKERLFSCNTTMSDLGSDSRREFDAGIASVSRFMERLESKKNHKAGDISLSNHLAGCSTAETSSHNNVEARGKNSLYDKNTSTTCSAKSDSS